MTAALVLAGAGLVNLLLVLLVAGILAAIAYYVLRLFLPHPIPALVAALIVVVALVDVLSGM